MGAGKARRRRARRRRNPFDTIRRRRYRRDPSLFATRRDGIIGQAMQTLVGGAGVAAGKLVARQGTALLKLVPGSPIGIAGQLAVALAAGIGADVLKLKGPFRDGMIYGAAAGAFESLLKLIVPGLGTKLLGEVEEYEVPLSAYPTAALPAGATVDQQFSLGAYATGVY